MAQREFTRLDSGGVAGAGAETSGIPNFDAGVLGTGGWAGVAWLAALGLPLRSIFALSCSIVLRSLRLGDRFGMEEVNLFSIALPCGKILCLSFATNSESYQLKQLIEIMLLSYYKCI